MVAVPSNLQRKDLIIVDTDKLTDLFQWRDNNKDIVRNFTPILKDIVIQVGGLNIHVEESDDPEMSFKYTVYSQVEKVLVQHWNKHTTIGYTALNRLPKDVQSDFHDYVESVISIYSTLMAYMEHYKETVDKKQVTSKQTKKAKKGKSKSKRVRSLHRTVYTLSGHITTDKEKRAYTSPSEPFKVRGHWRNYKSGKKVWIAEYPKNIKEGQEPEPSVYKF